MADPVKRAEARVVRAAMRRWRELSLQGKVICFDEPLSDACAALERIYKAAKGGKRGKA